MPSQNKFKPIRIQSDLAEKLQEPLSKSVNEIVRSHLTGTKSHLTFTIGEELKNRFDKEKTFEQHELDMNILVQKFFNKSYPSQDEFLSNMIREMFLESHFNSSEWGYLEDSYSLFLIKENLDFCLHFDDFYTVENLSEFLERDINDPLEIFWEVDNSEVAKKFNSLTPIQQKFVAYHLDNYNIRCTKYVLLSWKKEGRIPNEVKNWIEENKDSAFDMSRFSIDRTDLCKKFMVGNVRTELEGAKLEVIGNNVETYDYYSDGIDDDVPF